MSGSLPAPATSAPTASGAVAEPASSAYAWYVVSLLLFTNVLNFVDRKLPFILIESIKRDLQLSDTQIGLVGGLLFTGTYAIVGLILARISDRFSRKKVIVGSVALWSLFTGLGGLAQNFVQFALSRFAVAAAESGASPASHAIISDYFAPKKRALAMAVFSAGSSIGFMGGLMLGGYINDLANWRYAMFAVLVPGLLLAMIVAATVREPIRGASDGHVAERAPPRLTEGLAVFWQIRTLRYLLMGAACFGLAASGITAFSAAFFIRVHHLSTAQTGLLLGLALGIGGGIGSVLGGYVSDRAGRRDPRLRLWAPTAITLATPPAMVAALLVPDAGHAFMLLGIGVLASACYVAPTIAVAHGLLEPRLRATGSAIIFLSMQGIGASLGPVVVGGLSDGIQPWAGDDSLRFAMIATLAFMLAGSALYFLAGKSLRN